MGALPSGGSTWSDRRASNWCVMVKTDDVQKRNLESQFVELCTIMVKKDARLHWLRGAGDRGGTCHTSCSIFLLLLLTFLFFSFFQCIPNQHTHLPVPLRPQWLQCRQGNDSFASGISAPALSNVYLVLMKNLESKPVMQLFHFRKDCK